jgi:hypothetical protein
MPGPVPGEPGAFDISLCEDGTTIATQNGCFEQHRAFFICYATSDLDCDDGGRALSCASEQAALDACNAD